MPDGLPFSPFEVRDDSNPSGDGLSHLNGAKLGGAATRWAFRMLLHVVLQGIAILCRVFPFGVEGANGFHYLSEVVRARRPRWSAALSSHHQVIALALLSFWFWRTLHCPSFGFGVADRCSWRPPPPPGWHISR